MRDGKALLNAYLNGEPMSDAEQSALSQWVCDSPDHARQAAQLTHLDQAIRTHVREQATQPLIGMDDSDLIDQTLSRDAFAPQIMRELIEEVRAQHRHADASPLELTPRSNSQRDYHLTASDLSWAAGKLLRHAVFSKPAALTALAAAILLAIFLLSPFTTNNPARPADPFATTPQPLLTVATLTATHNAKWAEGALAPGPNLTPNQRLTLTQGFAEITTNRGAIAILQAPATIELIDHDNALRLHTGKLVGICETESSKGFLVRTPHMDITDVGTEFGVEVRENGVTTTVFTGEVEIQTPGSAPQRITANQTAHIDVAGNSREVVIENKLANDFTRRLPREAIVTAAHINLDGFKVDVVPQGVYEDAKLHTDRDHELNGLDANGLPAVLLGGDLVRTPADTRPNFSRGTESMRIEVELAQPADIYVLFGEFHPPDWLVRDYTMTTLKVGIDYGQSFTRPAQLGVGPGVSVDQVVNVWKRKRPASGRVLVGENMVSESAYQIIIVPTATNQR